MPRFFILHYIPEFAQTHVHWVDDATQLILCCPLFLHSIFPSIRVFSNELALGIRWPKYWSFSLKRLSLIIWMDSNVITSERQKQKKRKKEESGPGCSLVNTPLAIVTLKEESQEPINVGLLRRWKTQGNGFFFRASRKEFRPADTDFSPVRCVSDFWPLALLINSCSFES